MLLSLLLSWFLLLWVWWGTNRVTWPDSIKYLEMGSGGKPKGPFLRRWLLPWVCGTSSFKWTLVSYISIIESCLLLTHLTGTWTSSVLLMGLFGLVWMSIAGPILVDMPAFCLALVGVVVSHHFGHVAAAPFIILAALCKETAPFFAFAWTLEPLFLLLGLVNILHLKLTNQWWGGDDRKDPWLKSDLKELLPLGRKVHDWLGWKRMLLPWGALMILTPMGLWVAGDWKLTTCCVLSLLLAYSQMMIASDEGRLMGWAAVPLIVAASYAPVGPFLAPLLVLHVMNPSRSA